jgi:hypothetical protein
MQVSWIDADEVRDFVAELAEPARRSATAPDLDTLPEGGHRLGFALLTEDIAAFASQPGGEPAPADPSAVEAAILPDVSQIREKLRAIRDRAQEAGLLSKETPAERAARTPGPPVPVAQPLPSGPEQQSSRAVEQQSGGAAELQIPPAVAVPSAAPNPAPPTPPLPAPSVPVPPSPQTPPAAVAQAGDAREPDTIVERLNDFARWCSHLAASEELFMFDDHGDLIWGVPTSDDLLVCARLAMNAGMRSPAATLTSLTTSTPIQVAPGEELHLVACPTIYGTVIVALVNAMVVPVATLRERLATTLAKGR